MADLLIFCVGIVEPHDARADRRQAGAGHDEGLAVERIEALGDVARQFQVLRLVLAHGHDAGLVEQDVGGHQHGVLQQAVAHGFLFGGLHLVLRHALQPAHRRDAGEHPGQLGVRGHGGLHHDGAGLGIDAGGQIERGDLLDFGAQLGGVLVERDGVQVDDAEDALVIVLDAHPVLERAQVVSDVQISGRLHAGKDSCFHGKGMEVNLIVSNFEVTVEKLVYGGDGSGAPGWARGAGAVRAAGRARPACKRSAKSPAWCAPRTLEVLEPAPERVPAPCPVFGRCGGCHYQHAPYEYQLAAKRAILVEELRRLGKIEPPDEIAVVAGEPWGYRNRVQLHVERGRLGYREARSHKLCAIERAPSRRRRSTRRSRLCWRCCAIRAGRDFVRSLEIFTDEQQVQFNVLETRPPGGAPLLRLVRGDHSGTGGRRARLRRRASA